MSREPLWIAGIGGICAAGADISSILNSFENGIRNPTTAPADHSTIACPTFQVTTSLPTLPARYNNSRSLRLAMHAVREAMSQAKVNFFDSKTRVGICIGTTVASQLNCIPFYEAYRNDGNPPLDPVYDFLYANLAQAIGALLDVHGPRMTVVNACSSGTDSIGIAASWLRAGLCDIAIAGGADEINRVAIAGFHSLGVMSAELCAPFDRDRTGLNLGEGAGILLLESAAHANQRGAKPNFELAGFGQGSDAHHLTAPHPQGRGLESAITTALKMARIGPDEISFINAHGTATADNDRAEGNVIAKIFGTQIPFLSTKGYTGHTLGAAGGLEAAFTVAALGKGWIPASAGFQNQSDEIPIAPVSENKKLTGQYALSTSLAFGGNNSAVVIRRRMDDTTKKTEITSPERSNTPAQSKNLASSLNEASKTKSSSKPRQDPLTPDFDMLSSAAITPPFRTIETRPPTMLSQANLPPAHILGVGAVTPIGRDLQTISAPLAQPAARGQFAFAVPDEIFIDPAISKRLRRADRFTRMATIAAIDAWSAAGKNFPAVPMDRVGLIIATGFGPHPRGFKFLDGILDCGDADALPTDFSHSVHGAAAAYITEILDLRGPSITTTDFEMPFEQAIQLAQCWLAQNTCDRVLVGAVEELGEVMLHCAAKMAPNLMPGEGAIFLMLGKETALANLQATDITPACDLKIADPPLGIKTFTPYFGHSPVDTACQLLGVLLALKAFQPSSSTPGEGRGEGLPPKAQVDTASTFKRLSNSRTMSLLLTKI